MTAQDGLTRAEVSCQNLRAEKEILRSGKDRLVQEIDSLRHDQQSRDFLLINLQTIQVRVLLR